MKKSLQIFALLFCISIFAQAPEKFSYQAVIRNASNALVTNAPVGMKISILKTSAAGTVVYAETQTATTNVNGLVSIQIGAGTVVTGTIAGINWGADSYYIKTETDPAGGISYTIAGTTQLLSVPYALYSKNSGSGSGLTLPYLGSANNAIGLFQVVNTGSGTAIEGTNTSTANNITAVVGAISQTSAGSYSTGVRGLNNGTGGNGIGVWGSHNGSGYGVYGTTPTGYAVYGLASSSGTGVFGSSNTGTGVFGTSDTGPGLYGISNTGNALVTYGSVKMFGIGESAGKVLTSDVAGNATWQDASSKNVGITAGGLTSNQTALSGVWTTINKWGNLYEDGGANYNPAIGEYTIPKNGVYQINAQVVFNFYSAPGSYILLRVNTNYTGTEIGMQALGSNSAGGSAVGSPTLSIAHRFVAGDKITIDVLQASGADQIIGNFYADQMSIQYLHK